MNLKPQGDYYCGRNIGDNISREHLNGAVLMLVLVFVELMLEVMLGQWEYQIGGVVQYT